MLNLILHNPLFRGVIQKKHIPMEIAPSTPNAPKPNTPSPNNKPSNKPSAPPKNVDVDELRLRAYQRGWDGSPHSLMQYA